jgi:hypothetical protein
MSLELINTLASVATTAIVAAAAIAAMIQLRHLRVNNQIGLQLEIHKTFIDREFWNALGRARVEIPHMAQDPSFAAFARRYHRGAPAEGDDRFEGGYEAGLVVGRTFENIGNMVRNRLTDPRIFFEQYATLVVAAWAATEPIVRWRRRLDRSDLPWEDFEYLTVLSRRWLAEHGSVYPKDVERIIPPVAATTQSDDA